MATNDAGYIFWIRCIQCYPVFSENEDLLRDCNQESDMMKCEWKYFLRCISWNNGGGEVEYPRETPQKQAL